MTLVDVLLEEQSALITMKTNLLSDLSLKKESLMFKLDAKFKLYADEARLQGFGEGSGSVRLWIETLAQKLPRLQTTFLTLQSSIEHAKHLNETNSTLVAEQLAGISHRIAILTAASLDKKNQNEASTYGPQGGFKRSDQTNSRVVIR